MSAPVIAMVTDAIAPYHRGGKEQRYDELAPRLTLYADVHVYTMKWWRERRVTTTRSGVAYHAICPFMPLYRGERRSIAQALMFACACLRLLFARFDVLEADHMPYLQLFPLKFVVFLRRKRMVVTWHEVWDRAQWKRYLGPPGLAAWWLERLAMRTPDCIIAASPQTAERLNGMLDGRVPVVVAPNGIDLDLVVNTPAAPDAVDVVSVGRLLSHKRFDMLLEAIALLASAGKPTTCRIIGNGPERASLRAQAAQLGISHLVDFRDDVQSTEELLSLVKAAGVFVFPSEREGFGIAALEAIACGLPVITTISPHNFARHLVERSEQGVLCEHSPEALAAGIDSAMGKPGCERPELDHDWLSEYDWTIITARIAHALSGNGVAPQRQLTSVAEPDGPSATVPRSPSEPPPGPAPGGPEDPDETRPRPTRSRWLPDALVSLVAIGAMAGLASVRGAWIVQAVELLLLLSVPGVLLVRALRVEPEAVRRFPLYVVAGSIAVLMVGGLLVDLVGPAVGISRPLTTTPLAVSISVVCLVLVALTVVREAPPVAAYTRLAGNSIPVHRLWPLVLPVIAWVGAMRLNNGHDATVAIVALAVTGAALLAGVWGAQRWSAAHTATLIYGASLALIWGFSMRGHFVYGYDINAEYQTFIGTLHAGRWHVSHPGDAYGAMLSLTILPSVLSTLTGAGPLLVLKVIFPFLFAFFPVAVFLLATRALRLRFAYLAVLFIVIQNYLFQELPGIARQEIALLFFVCLVAALLDARLRRGPQIGLLGAFGLGLVFSHYGTTYIAVAVIAIAVMLELVQSAIRAPVSGLRARVAEALSRSRRLALVPLLSALAITAGAAAIWYQPLTDSAQNVSSFVSDLSDQGLSILPNSNGAGLVRSYLSGNAATRVSGRSYAARIHSEYGKTARYVHPLPQAFLPRYRVQNATEPGQAVKSQAAVTALNTEQTLVSQLAILLAAIGALWLWWRRDAGDTARGLAVLGVGTLAILMFIRLSGTAANDYNQDRAFLQAMVPLAVCLAWLLQLASTRRRFGPAVAGIAAVALGLAFLTTSGLRGTFAGGGSLTNIATSGEDYDHYYVTQPEQAAARWMVASAPKVQVFAADRYGALRIQGATGLVNGVLANVTPSSLDGGAWIYADSANFLGHRAQSQDGSRYAIYAWPSFIGAYWNLVYSNGSSAIYARTH